MTSRGVVLGTLIAAGSCAFLVFVVVRILSRIDDCANAREVCTGGERIPEAVPSGVDVRLGCGDEADNDGDGLVDQDDPDCIGVQGWAVGVETAACFGLESATTDGTVADVNDPVVGLIDPQDSFQQVIVMPPEPGSTRDRVFAAAVLSFLKPVILPPLDAAPVLRLNGRMAVPVEDEGPGCALDVVAEIECDECHHDRQPTAVSVRGEIVVPSVSGIDIRVHYMRWVYCRLSGLSARVTVSL